MQIETPIRWITDATEPIHRLEAFQANLVPQDPRDEPASELLNRIRTTREKIEAKKKATKKKTKRKARKHA